MNIRLASGSLVTAMLFACAPALAATATAISFLNMSYEPNILGPNNTSCTSSNVSFYECDRVLDAPLLATDPDGVRSEVTFYREAYSPLGDGSTPDGILKGQARAYALPGSLHAEVEVQLTGRGYSPGNGISGFGYVAVEDRLRITSETLATGTAVVLNTQFAVGGQGRGSVGLSIRGSRPPIPGLAGVFGDSDNSNSNSISLDSISGQFTAYVGENLYLEYWLRASTGVSDGLWKPIDVLNGRNASSSYGNSAYLYFAAEDPSVQWVADSGASYRAAVVPEPGTYAMMLLGLAGLAAIARRRASRQFAASR